MPLYLMLTTLTEKGVQTLNSNPGRLREVNRDVEELGARVLHQWASLGAYDFVNVVEAPDDLTLAKLSRRARRAWQRQDRVAAARPGRRSALLAGVGARPASPRRPRGQATANPVARAVTVERARGQAGLRLDRVEAAGGDVVRRLRVEERREQLDVAAADAELPLAAAVGADAVLLAVVVGREEPLDASRTATA